MKTTNKKTKRGAIISLALAGALIITGAFAFFSDSDSAINRFSFADEDGEQTVDVRIEEPNWDETEGENVLPLDTVVKDPIVINDGENGAYAYVSVLVPTAKEIVMNNSDGTKYTLNDVELFSYKVLDGWTEVDATTVPANVTNAFSLGFDGDTGVETFRTLKEGSDARLVNAANAPVTNKSTTSANVYYTAHVYAYALDGSMTEIASETQTTPVFETVTMINIADGSAYMTPDEVLASIVTDDTKAIEGTEIVVSNDTTRKVVYNIVEEDGVTKVVNAETGKAMTKIVSQLVAEDNINIYVNTYAVQSDNLGTTDINEVWDITANTNAGVAEGSSYTNDFYFEVIDEDIGAKSSVKGA